MTHSRIGLVLSCLVLSCLVLDGSGVVPDSWTHYQHDAAHTGRSSAAITPAQLDLAWSAPDYTSPLIVGETLYAKSYDGLSTVVSAFALADGQLLWTHPGTDIYFANMVVSGPLVLLEGFDFGDPATDTLTVLDRATGQFLYKMLLPLSFSFLDPTVTRDQATGKVVAFASDGSTLVRLDLDAASGAITWTRTGDFGTSSVPTLVGDSVVVVGSGSATAFDQATGAPNTFFVDASPNLNSGAPVAFDAARGDFYVKLDYQDAGRTRVRAFHYDGNDSINLLWTRTTPLDQFGGMPAIGPDRLYVVRSGELAMLDPDDGATLKAVPFPWVNGCSPVLTRNVVWVYSDTQTFAYDARSLALLRTFEGSAGFNLGFVPLGAFTPGTAVLNLAAGDVFGLDVYRNGK
jgi:hypothetical protein